MVERNEAPSRGQSERGRWTKQAHVPLETSEDQRLVQAVPLLPKTQDAWRSFGQRHRRVRSAVLKRATLTLCSRAHGRAAAQRWLALGSASTEELAHKLDSTRN